MHQLVHTLSEFRRLDSLVLSWGVNVDDHPMSAEYVAVMMRALRSALDAENADIDLQLCYRLHPESFGGG